MRSFTPDRLTMIRERRGWSMNTLARESGVSVRSIRFYEAGDQTPGDAAISKLSNALRVPSSWFEGPPISGLEQEAASFRAATKLPAYRRRAAVAAGRLGMHFTDWMISERFDLPPVDIPDLADSDPELAAEEVRAAWGLGNQPAPNMIHLLEAHGCSVYGLAEDCRELDAFCFWRHDRPYVLLNTVKSGERGRMDAAHELAHLVLHRSLDVVGQDQEREAMQFASAFLMPRKAMVTYRGPRSLSQVLEIKRAWQVAAVALVYRLHALGLMSEWHYRTLMVELSKRGYRRGEPDGIVPEQSKLLTDVLRAMRADGVSVADIAASLDILPDDLAEMLLGLTLVSPPSR
jgi:Zn-dependent peptidase ImmA (M78 family)/DNA-binding XRE family transcriptional regulator